MENRYTKNSKLHHALDVLSMSPLIELDLKRKINYTSSVPRFNQHVIIPLLTQKFIHREGPLYKITSAGDDMLRSLGRIKIKLPASSKFVPTGSYDGKELTKGAVRASGDDHFKWPSRRGDMLFYRDGRVEAA